MSDPTQASPSAQEQESLVVRLAKHMHEAAQTNRDTIFGFGGKGHHAAASHPETPDDDSFYWFENCIHPDCVEARLSASSSSVPTPQSAESDAWTGNGLAEREAARAAREPQGAPDWLSGAAQPAAPAPPQKQTTAASEVETFWRTYERSYDAESRAECEAEAKANWNPPSPIAVAMHKMWKRNVKPDYAPPPLAVSPQAETLTFETFAAVNRQRCESPSGFNHSLDSWDTSDWFLAVLGELGEAANVAKKLNRVRDGIPGNKESPDELRAKLRKEIGDVFVYLDLLAQAHGFTVAAAAVEVFNAKSEEIGCSIQMPLAAAPVRSVLQGLIDQWRARIAKIENDPFRHHPSSSHVIWIISTLRECADTLAVLLDPPAPPTPQEPQDR